MKVGAIVRLVPVYVVPIIEPPVDVVYHLMKLLVVTALRLMGVPHVIVEGEDNGDVGAGNPLTVIESGTLVETPHVAQVSA